MERDMHEMLNALLPAAGSYLLVMGIYVLVFMRRPPLGTSYKQWAKIPMLPIITAFETVRCWITGPPC